MLRRCLEGRNTPFRRVRPPSRAPYKYWHVAHCQKTVPGRVRVKFAQNGGHEKATKKPRKSNEKGPNTVFLDSRGPRPQVTKSLLTLGLPTTGSSGVHPLTADSSAESGKTRSVRCPVILRVRDKRKSFLRKHDSLSRQLG